MNTWILIIILYANGNGTTVHSNGIEFKSQESCNEARTEIFSEFKKLTATPAIILACVKK